MSTTRGVIYIHSAIAALRPHIEWAISGVLGVAVNLRWSPQPALMGTYRAECAWRGTTDTIAALVSALCGCQRLRFEITQDVQGTAEGQRYSYTPALGVFFATTNASGDIVVDENRLRTAMRAAAIGKKTLDDAIAELLGTPWDDELEAFRYAGADTPVRWLHAAV